MFSFIFSLSTNQHQNHEMNERTNETKTTIIAKIEKNSAQPEADRESKKREIERVTERSHRLESHVNLSTIIA